MGEASAIEWTDHTFNPWEGCQKVGPGCDHCYAETRNARFGGGTAPNWGPGAPRRRTSKANWNKPLQWQAGAAAFAATHGRRQRVFCASLADVFDNAVDPQWRVDLADLIGATPDLDWLLLTKRIGNVFPRMWGEMFGGDVPANVWLGATIVNQVEADRDIAKLLGVPGPRFRFLSMEPLLGPVDLTRVAALPDPHDSHDDWKFNALIGGSCFEFKGSDGYWYDGDGPVMPALDWVIVGGESGSGARPMHPDWVISLRDQCEAAEVPFLFKQWGEHLPVDVDTIHRRGIEFQRVGKKAAGRRLHGLTHNGVPA